MSSRAFSLIAVSFFILLVCNAQPGYTQSDTSGYHKLVDSFFSVQARVRYVYQTSISPDASALAWSADSDNGPAITVRLLTASRRSFPVSAGSTDSIKANINETEPQWSPDGKTIAFLSDAHTPGSSQVFLADGTTGKLIQPGPLTRFDGFVSHLKWSPDGRYISVLYVHNATREPSPMAAENKAIGLIDSMSNNNVQMVAVIDRVSGKTTLATPSKIYVFEYDWSPDSRKLAYTAAPPPGDDNWYISRLYTQTIFKNDSICIYIPKLQIALPRWSPDNRHIAFIEGLMSDQGGTGGEIFSLDVSQASAPENLTPGRKSTPSWFAWTAAGNIMFTEFKGGSIAINSLDPATRRTSSLYNGDEYLRAGNEEMSLSIGKRKGHIVYATIRTSWTLYPEVWAGESGQWKKISSLNDSTKSLNVASADIRWTSNAQPVQGWLLPPINYDSSRKYPLLVCVHGGPAWISTATWSAPDFNSTLFPRLGYFVFFPNPRGSYGQGEKFTQANRRDWGFGDLRDILDGIDTIARRFSIDTARMGIYGWSYGGSMAMFSVTQTNRFRASVSGAGASDWLSYYGQNSIDKWMQSYFEVSPYDDPEPYRKVSAMTYIKKIKTPTLVLVGERDGECPAPQSFQYWHALKELGIPTQLMIYPDEGHSFEKYEHMTDVCLRTLEWFNRYLVPQR